MRVRTMVYLDQEQLRALKDEAHTSGISLAELLRRIVKRHQDGGSPARTSDEAYMSLVGLGTSGREDVSEDHDRHLGDALWHEHAR